MYISASDVRAALSPSSGDGQFRTTASDLLDRDIAVAIIRACAKIDLALSGQYVTPVGLVNGVYPDIIVAWAVDIAAYYATLTWRQNQPLDPTHPVALRYAATVADLAAVASGAGSLPLPVPPPTTDSGVGDSELFNPCPVGLAAAVARSEGSLPIDFPYPIIGGYPRGRNVTRYLSPAVPGGPTRNEQ